MFTPAFAQTATDAAGAQGIAASFLPFALIIAIMYFLILRPQQKKVKQHEELVKGIRRGDHIVTSGGILGKVTKAVDNSPEVEVEVADGVKIRIMRGAVSEVRSSNETSK